MNVGASTSLFSRLAHAVRARRRPFVLVFDDVHVLSNSECLAALTVIVDQLPGGAQLALASRTEPDLTLGRRRAHRGLAELKQRDLAMTRSEGGDLLARMGLKLESADVARLFRRAEGWPVAIYLAGLSLRGQRDAGRAVARFAGDDRLVVDYVRDEFLAGLSRRKLEFLTRTSVLNTLAGPSATPSSSDRARRKCFASSRVRTRSSFHSIGATACTATTPSSRRCSRRSCVTVSRRASHCCTAGRAPGTPTAWTSARRSSTASRRGTSSMRPS